MASAVEEAPPCKRAKVAASLAVGWFRNDLRLRDNPMLQTLIDGATKADIPAMLVYILDPRFYDASKYGRVTDQAYEKSISTRKPVDFSSRKCDCRRARFYLNVLRDLQRGLGELGTKLHVFYGKPEEIFPALQEQYGALDVVCLKEPVSPEWTDVEDSVEASLKAKGGTLTRLWGAMSLFHEEDLPFKAQESPSNYSALAHAVGWEDIWTSAKQRPLATPIRKAIPAPVGPWRLKASAAAPSGALADDALDDDSKYLGRLGYSAAEVEATLRAPHGGSRKGKGGETAAWARLNAWIEKPPVPEKKDPGFVPLGASFGAAGAVHVEDGAIDAMQWKNLSRPHGWMQLSKYLACGCISPREMYHTLARGSAPFHSPHWALAGVVHRLMWREWHRSNAIKYHRRFYWLQGPGRQNRIWKDDPEAAARWKSGQTGIPYIDACMRELNETGWLAYKGRKTVATFLAHDIWLDWRIGAFHFEEVLLDYDVAMNYGNWGFCARVDKDYYGQDWRDKTHEDLKSTIRAEAAGDPDAAYVKQWVPELKSVPVKFVHTPWMMPAAEAELAGCAVGKDYPQPLIPAARLQFLAFEGGEN
eukprot:CAMPEP_0117520872 /NCGR_PEP_ID=MMETSP0784-20121206/33390_1 /TAXON_ID=39447 /ORGANISM="" /LENGTH=588 /DNA_ID=CAMNT_0005316875 /DNA_START=15 /DNA_END=1781 /DNA_ORIENTATION=+